MPISLPARVSYFLRKCSQKPHTTTAENASQDSNADMDRCLTTFDLIQMGCGSLTGANLYIIPSIIVQQAGLAGIVSCVLTTICTLSTGLHYAELASFCPNTAGSVYMYVYFTLGEMPAVIVGWSLLVEYLVGICFTSVGFSEILYSISDGFLRHYEVTAMESIVEFLINICFTAVGFIEVLDSIFDGFIHFYEDKATDSIGLPHIHLTAGLVCMLLTWVTASGLQLSLKFVKAMNVITIAIIVFFVTASLGVGTTKNWEQSGFTPFGLEGITASIPTCYFAVVGFDCIVPSGSECRTPDKSIPIALFTTIIIGGFLFITLPVVFITFDVPLEKIPPRNGILEVFSPLGYDFVKYIMGIGAVSSLLITIFGSLYPLTRITYALARDGFLLRYFGKICPKRQTPFRATIACGAIATVISAFLDLHLLLNIGVMASLVCYVFVIASTLFARYNFNNVDNNRTSLASSTTALVAAASAATVASAASQIPTSNNSSTSAPPHQDTTHSDYFTFQSVSSDDSKGTTIMNKIRQKFTQLQSLSRSYIKSFLFVIHVCIVICCVLVERWHGHWDDIPTAVIVVLILLLAILFLLCVLMMSLPQTNRNGSYRSLLIPYVSLGTTAINIYFLMLLTRITWLFFFGWILVGLCLYTFYGCYGASDFISHSTSPNENSTFEAENVSRPSETDSTTLIHTS